MSDLSNLLGELYGDSSTQDGPPLRREPAAAERTEWSAGRPDDDLAAALTAALADTEKPAAYAAPVEAVAAPAPVAPAAPIAAPVAPAEVNVSAAWTSAPAPEPVMASVPVSAPASVVHQGPRMWARGDDDIAPVAGGAKKKRK